MIAKPGFFQCFRNKLIGLFCGLMISLIVPSIGRGEETQNQSGDPEKPETPQQAETETAPLPNQAYGAYQRGQYLTAFKLALPLANLGDPAAQTLIAELYEKGLGIARNKKEATAWYEIAANAGNREAQFSFAIKLLEGKYIKEDRKRAMKLMQSAADAGHSVAMYNYAQQLISNNPGSKGFKAAFPYLEKSASAGVVDAYYALSQVYDSGMGLKSPDAAKAKTWLLKAAHGGVDTAQIELALQLANGKGESKDEKSARNWFQRAALTGNVIAQNRLAHMLARGMGGPVNAVQSAKWYILARRAGHTDFRLDDFLDSLSREDRAKALDAANHWRPR